MGFSFKKKGHIIQVTLVIDLFTKQGGKDFNNES